LRSLSLFLPATNCSLIFVNQTISNISKGPAKGKPGKTTPGGGAVKFWASKRLKVRQTSKINYPKDDAGIVSTIRTVKDKIDPPHREVDLPVMFSTGIDSGYELVNFLIDNSSFVNQSGARIKIPDYPVEGHDLSFYRKALPEKIAEDPDLIDYLQACADSAWEEKYGA